MFEESEEFNGLQFGKRGSQTISARIYDKTVESAKEGLGVLARHVDAGLRGGAAVL